MRGTVRRCVAMIKLEMGQHWDRTTCLDVPDSLASASWARVPRSSGLTAIPNLAPDGKTRIFCWKIISNGEEIEDLLLKPKTSISKERCGVSGLILA